MEGEPGRTGTPYGPSTGSQGGRPGPGWLFRSKKPEGEASGPPAVTCLAALDEDHETRRPLGVHQEGGPQAVVIVVVVWSSRELLEDVRHEAEQLEEAHEHHVAGEDETLKKNPRPAEEVAQTRLKSVESCGAASRGKVRSQKTREEAAAPKDTRTAVEGAVGGVGVRRDQQRKAGVVPPEGTLFPMVRGPG